MGSKPNPNRKMKTIVCSKCEKTDSVPDYRVQKLCNECYKLKMKILKDKAAKKKKEKKENPNRYSKRFLCEKCHKTFISKYEDRFCNDCKNKTEKKTPGCYSDLNKDTKPLDMFNNLRENIEFKKEDLCSLIEELSSSFESKK